MVKVRVEPADVLGYAEDLSNSFSSVETLLKWRELAAKTAYMRLFYVENKHIWLLQV